MNLYQDFKMVKQVLMEEEWMFDKIQYIYVVPSTPFHHFNVLMKVH